MKQLYRSYGESTDIFKDLENRFPSYIKLESIGKTWEKRDINLITISKDIKTAHTRPALFFTVVIKGVPLCSNWTYGSCLPNVE